MTWQARHMSSSLRRRLWIVQKGLSKQTRLPSMFDPLPRLDCSELMILQTNSTHVRRGGYLFPTRKHLGDTGRGYPAKDQVCKMECCSNSQSSQGRKKSKRLQPKARGATGSSTTSRSHRPRSPGSEWHHTGRPTTRDGRRRTRF